jgi:vacuolar-type H+-ATPase subunit C/Vma6
VARARGLRSRLLSGTALRELAQVDDRATLAGALATRGYAVAAPVDAWTVEEAVRAGMSCEIAALCRWLRRRQRGVVAALFVDEDRRNVRRLLRGLLADRSAAQRAQGASSTPGLSTRRLTELAQQPTLVTLATRLRTWNAAFDDILVEAARPEPRAARLEAVLDRVAATVLDAARRAGGESLAAFARGWIDGANACTAIVLAGGEREVVASESFLPGGSRLGRAWFDASVAAGSSAAAGRRLAPLFRGSFGAALARGVVARGRLEVALTKDLWNEQVALARRFPLSAAPVAAYALALQVEAAALRCAGWRIELGLAREAA